MSHLTLTITADDPSDLKNAITDLAACFDLAKPVASPASDKTEAPKTETAPKAGETAAPKKSPGRPKKPKVEPYVLHDADGDPTEYDTAEDAIAALAQEFRDMADEESLAALSGHNQGFAQRLIKEKNDDGMAEIKKAMDEARAGFEPAEEPAAETSGDVMPKEDPDDDVFGPATAPVKKELTHQDVIDIFTRVLDLKGAPAARALMDKKFGEGVKVRDLTAEQWADAYAAAAEELGEKV